MPRSRLASLRLPRSSQRAKHLRSHMTDAEHRLWYYLRAGRYGNFKFRRQVPLGPYVADFLCERARLIVEVDGGHHADSQDADAVRSAWLERHGYRVVRVWNNDVLGNVEGVLEALAGLLG